MAKRLISYFNSVAMHETPVTWNSLSNQSAFCWSMQQFCEKLKPVAKSAWGIILPQFLITWISIEMTSKRDLIFILIQQLKTITLL